ncbi:acyl-homoserine-lactone synthase [Yokenella regensburgei]|uniref:acyl-homoserine-lactone synthase n=1 Tax=Yokenella regensburgei TaxID=158877 RepID=UPI003ED9E3C0
MSNSGLGSLEFFDVTYETLVSTLSDELYRLRKITFSDRLGWEVICRTGMESDEFDTHGTRYILGVSGGQIICSVRFIGLERPNMINRTFSACFSDVMLPPVGIESSRFFVDKARVSLLPGKSVPVSQALFVAMINWARHNDYNGIHTIVSRAMLTILKRTGWKIDVLREAFLSKQERIYLLYLPTTAEDQAWMASKLTMATGHKAKDWPMELYL